MTISMAAAILGDPPQDIGSTNKTAITPKIMGRINPNKKALQ
jgi:hypothetical protein